MGKLTICDMGGIKYSHWQQEFDYNCAEVCDIDWLVVSTPLKNISQSGLIIPKYSQYMET